jgi:lysophospholipase L1-like esterase
MKRAASFWALGTAVVVVAACASPAEPASPSSAPISRAKSALSLVVIGDSIPFNSQEDCPNCKGFVDQYAESLAKAASREVTTENRSEHTGLTLPGLMDQLPTLKADLSGADAIIVGIAHNSFPLNDEAPCGSSVDPATGVLNDWTKVDSACAATATNRYRPTYDELFSTIASWRAAKPTILLTLNRYNDWIGFEQAKLTAEQAGRTVALHDAWNAMICDSAKANGFDCVDIYHAFNGLDGSQASAGLLSKDYTHPSQKGNDEIAGLLADRGFAPFG